jgi:hypothetical protein
LRDRLGGAIRASSQGAKRGSPQVGAIRETFAEIAAAPERLKGRRIL